MTDIAYFTPDEARAQESAISNPDTYPDAIIDAMRVAVETDLEKACGVAFVQRTATETLRGPFSHELCVSWSRPTSVVACTIDRYDLDADALANLTPYPDGAIERRWFWTHQDRNREAKVVITYTHGYADGELPGRVKRDAIKLTKRFLVETPISDRATQITNPDGSSQWVVQAGVFGAKYDIPELNALVIAYEERARVG